MLANEGSFLTLHKNRSTLHKLKVGGQSSAKTGETKTGEFIKTGGGGGKRRQANAVETV